MWRRPNGPISERWCCGWGAGCSRWSSRSSSGTATMWAYIVLTALRDGPARAQATLAAAINADKTRLIPVLDDLQRRGLIEREPDPADRRVRLLGLTPEGRRLQQAVQAEIREGEEVILAKIKDRAAFVRALGELSA